MMPDSTHGWPTQTPLSNPRRHTSSPPPQSQLPTLLMVSSTAVAQLIAPLSKSGLSKKLYSHKLSSQCPSGLP